MRRRRFLVLSLAALAAAACRRGPAFAPLPAGSVVLAFGDSATFGTGAGPGEDWPSRLAEATGWRVENAGLPGDTAEAARQRLDGLLAEHRPALVIVELGGNDFLRRRSHAAVKADLREILRGIRAQGGQAVLVAVPELSLMALVAGRPSDAELYEELAEEAGVPLVPEVFARVLGEPDLRADQVHPNARGYAAMARGIHDRLRTLGLAG